MLLIKFTWQKLKIFEKNKKLCCTLFIKSSSRSSYPSLWKSTPPLLLTPPFIRHFSLPLPFGDFWEGSTPPLERGGFTLWRYISDQTYDSYNDCYRIHLCNHIDWFSAISSVLIGVIKSASIEWHEVRMNVHCERSTDHCQRFNSECIFQQYRCLLLASPRCVEDPPLKDIFLDDMHSVSPLLLGG